MRRTSLNAVIRFAATLLLLTLILWWVGPGPLWRSVTSASTLPLALAIGLAPIGVGMTLAVWRTVLYRIDPDTGWMDCIRGVLVGASTGLITPARVGEIAPRILYGRPEHRSRRAAGFLLESALRFCAQFFLAGLAWLLTAPLLFPEIKAGILGIGGGLIAMGMVLLGVTLRPRWAMRRLAGLPLIRNHVGDWMSMPIVGPGSVLFILILTILRYGVATAQFTLLLAAVGVGIHIAPAALVLFGKGIVPNLFITDLGIREGLSAFVFGRLGFDPAAAVAASLLIYLMNLVLPALAGVLLVRRPDRT